MSFLKRIFHLLLKPFRWFKRTRRRNKVFAIIALIIVGSIIGTQIQNAITKYLTGRLPLNPIDFNPMFQFIHEFDMASILERSIDELPTGVYNVAPNDFISIKDALAQSQGQSIPFPVSLGKPINMLLQMIGMDIPDYFIDYLKYSCLIFNGGSSGLRPINS